MPISSRSLRLILIPLLGLSCAAALAEYDDQTVERRVGYVASQSAVQKIVEIPGKKVRLGAAPTTMNRASAFINQAFGIPTPPPEIRIEDFVQKKSFPNYQTQLGIVADWGGAIAKSNTLVTAKENLSSVEAEYKKPDKAEFVRLQDGALGAILDGKTPDPAAAAIDGHDVSSSEKLIQPPFEDFKKTAAAVTASLTNSFKEADAKQNQEIEQLKKDAVEKFQNDLANAEQQQRAAEQKAAQQQAAAAAQQAAKNAGGGGSGGGGGGSRQSLKSPEIPDGGRSLASPFDPSSLAQPKAGDDLNNLIKAGGGNATSPRRASDDLINPVTMSNPAVTPGNSKLLGDTSPEAPKGFKLGGAKTALQSLTFAGGDGALPPVNQAGAAAAPGAPMGAGGGSGGVSGEPSQVGVDKGGKSASFNPIKTAGYGDGASGVDTDEAGDGAVDGGPEAAEAKGKENLANINRPGQFLPARAADESGFPGVFAYRQYLRKLCDTSEGRQGVAVCGRKFTYRPKPVVQDVPGSFMALSK